MIDPEYLKKIKNICEKRNENASPDPQIAVPLDTYPHMFILCCITSIQMPPLEGWKIPEKIAEDLTKKGLLENAKNPSFEVFLRLDEEYYADILEKKQLHKYARQTAHHLCSALRRIRDLYGSDASNIWSDRPGSAELIGRLMDFEGIGRNTANMATCMLNREYHVNLKDRYSIDIMTDIHVKRTFCRLGLIDMPESKNISDIDADRLVYKAREISPEYPGMLDLQCWEIGIKRICLNDSCRADNTHDCPFFDICPRIGLPKNRTVQEKLPL